MEKDIEKYILDLIENDENPPELFFEGEELITKITVYPSKESIIELPSFHVLIYKKDDGNDKVRYYAYALDFGLLAFNDVNTQSDVDYNIKTVYNLLEMMVIELLLHHIINGTLDHIFDQGEKHDQGLWGVYGKKSQEIKIKRLKFSLDSFMSKENKDLIAYKQSTEKMREYTGYMTGIKSLETKLKQHLKYEERYDVITDDKVA